MASGELAAPLPCWGGWGSGGAGVCADAVTPRQTRTATNTVRCAGPYLTSHISNPRFRLYAADGLEFVERRGQSLESTIVSDEVEME